MGGLRERAARGGGGVGAVAEAGRAKSWHTVAETDEIEDEDILTAEVGGRFVAICRVGDSYYATAGHCTHEDEPLTDGMVIDGVIECPLHQGRFCARTGRAVGAPASVDLETYPVRIEDGCILVGLPDEHG